ncbi:unnamed protein product [Boreogadus saida]
MKTSICCAAKATFLSAMKTPSWCAAERLMLPHVPLSQAAATSRVSDLPCPPPTAQPWLSFNPLAYSQCRAISEGSAISEVSAYHNPVLNPCLAP